MAAVPRAESRTSRVFMLDRISQTGEYTTLPDPTLDPHHVISSIGWALLPRLPDQESLLAPGSSVNVSFLTIWNE